MAAKAESVPKATFDSTNVSAGDAFRAWADFVKSVYQIRPLVSDGRGHRAASTSWIINDLVFGRSRFDPQIMDRRIGREIADGTRKFLFLISYRSGSSQVVHDSEPLELRPGLAYLLDFDRECRSIATAADVIGVAIPYESVDYNPTVHPARYCFDFETPAGRIFDATLLQTLDSLDDLPISAAADLAAFFCGAVSGMIKSATAAAPKTTPTAGSIREYVDANIFNPPPVAADLADRFNISRATLYRQFEHFGGLQSYIEMRRLDYAMRSLAFGPAIRGRIAEIARLTGYSSPNQFSRAFRRRFGFSPSNAMNAFTADPVTGGNGGNALWETWHGRP